MWRLKIAEGYNSPYLYSTNNFIGRQIWEFNPNGRSPEEREEVENARTQFWNNRCQVKPCSDLLWRMQVSISLLKTVLFPLFLKKFSNTFSTP